MGCHRAGMSPVTSVGLRTSRRPCGRAWHTVALHARAAELRVGARWHVARTSQIPGGARAEVVGQAGATTLVIRGRSTDGEIYVRIDARGLTIEERPCWLGPRCRQRLRRLAEHALAQLP